MRALFIMYYFEIAIMVYNAHFSWIMVYKALLITDIFRISYMKWYRFYNNNLSVLLECKQGGTLKLKNPKHEDWASIPLLSLSVLTFLSRCQVIFQWKQTKEKLRNAFSAWENFRVDLTWWMENIFPFF